MNDTAALGNGLTVYWMIHSLGKPEENMEGFLRCCPAGKDLKGSETINTRALTGILCEARSSMALEVFERSRQ